ncbi:Transporter, sodium/sulfate symporter family [uncultured Gammaproteobacteria bacterium]|jgi:di/tricarboxylate transporter|nr:Transporter, sodium/sulfate symporter family [uncultured Gammaproteobacteria bacterium]CAC9556197.1 Transporter, sodium/sulfate symporter family [uncultured Gammaproteobacteria bacterium]CAC9568197.1 Transporter, sodium/sulfate symporter family [uncultured Gammaproteobacteria bacterium]CAC9569971.1 Transporter, sodium/sulfate symporter family [uncultured Gammaproteobacteria bacterium]CAC9578566.1 Transporter, sodium/sulfate symporter family [uncultured Gammaproteobacteria bacterium]
MLNKKIVAALVFSTFALWLSTVAPSTPIAWMLSILLLTIYLFAFEVVEVDEAAITVMVILGLTSLPFVHSLMGLEGGLVDSEKLFTGFSSNAVMSIIAVMIIGAGLDKTGLMSKVAAFILKVGGRSETRIIPIVSSAVGFISSFMQNVGAAALFIPVVNRISTRSGVPMSRLLMPMGFTAILGGTMTMVGSSPLILLNDLILTTNQGLSVENQMHTWGLFSVTPIGIALVLTGIAYFVIAGKFVLPVDKKKKEGTSVINHIKEVYGIDYDLFEVSVPMDSGLVGMTLDQVETIYKIRVIAVRDKENHNLIGHGSVERSTEIQAEMTLGVLTSIDNLEGFVEGFGLKLSNKIEKFSDILSTQNCGTAEVVIPPNSSLIGKTARDVWLRKAYGLAMVALHRGGETMKEGEGIRDIAFQSGDTLVVYVCWDDLDRLRDNPDFIAITNNYPQQEETRPEKVKWAGLFFGLALFLVLFTDIRLSIALLTGALGMILTKVLNIEEAYRAVSWKTVFLLASLIPLGLAVSKTGTALWIAQETVAVVGDMAPWIILTAIAVLATFFTLVMSNVGATILLVPIAVNIAIQVGADPAIYALTVAIATSNSFLIPTHQVNALIMGPGGYKVVDFIKAGGIMTILFLVVMMTMMSIVF